MNLTILVPVHNRIEFFPIFLKHLKRAFQIMDAHLVIVASDESDHKELKKALRSSRIPHTYTTTQNKPLGAKLNHGLSVAKETGADYFLFMGDDDLISDGLWDIYAKMLSQGFHYIGLRDMYILDKNSGQIKYFQGYSRERTGDAMGVGRCLHANLLEMMDWQAWDPNISKGLDHSMDQKLMHFRMKSVLLRCKDYGVAVVDVKGADNIWGLHQYQGQLIDMKELQSMFSRDVLTGKLINRGSKKKSQKH